MIRMLRKSLWKQKLRLTAIFLTFTYFFTFIASPVLANISYTYDKNGNMLSDGTNCYTYNDENQMVKTTNCSTGKLIDQSIYDYQGNRIKQQIYDINGNLLKTIYTPFPDYEYTVLASNSAKLSTTYYHANGEVIARKNPDQSLTYYLHDNLGSTTTLLDQNGKVTENTTYSPYGTVTSGGTQAKHLYTGQVNDTQANPQSHLDYYNARYYNPHTMHFTQPDTQINNVYDPQQLNRYSYVGNNPMSKNDPSGHCFEPVSFAVCAGVVLAYGFLGFGLGGAVYGATHTNDHSIGGILKGAWNGFNKAADSAVGQVLMFGAIAGMSAGGGSENNTIIEREATIENKVVQTESNSRPISTNLGSPIRGQQLTIGDHIKDNIPRYGWTQDEIHETVSNPTKIIPNQIDHRNLPGGGRVPNEPATGYMNKSGNGVIVNDITGDVVQVNDKNDPTWKYPWDK